MARGASAVAPQSETRISKPACYEPGINADRIRNLRLYRIGRGSNPGAGDIPLGNVDVTSSAA
jgi:hypothetical protein